MYLCGQLGLDRAGNLVPGGVEAETEQVSQYRVKLVKMNNSITVSATF